MSELPDIDHSKESEKFKGLCLALGAATEKFMSVESLLIPLVLCEAPSSRLKLTLIWLLVLRKAALVNNVSILRSMQEIVSDPVNTQTIKTALAVFEETLEKQCVSERFADSFN